MPLACYNALHESLEEPFFTEFHSSKGDRPIHSQLPHYIARGGEQVTPAPTRLQNVTHYGFVLDSDYDTLQTLCDTYLNAPTNGEIDYRPVLPCVMLTFTDVESLQPQNPPHSQQGRISETEVALWVLTVSMESRFIPIPSHLAWFVPYIFVDNSYSMAGGREIYGYPKQLGTIQIPDNGQDADCFALETVGIKSFAPDTFAVSQPLLEVCRTDDGVLGDVATIWNGIEDAFNAATSRLIDGANWEIPGVSLISDFFNITLEDVIERFLNNFLNRSETPIVFLKQFRDVEDGTRACYQAIVEAALTGVHFRQGGMLDGDYQLTLHHLNSHPIADELGLQIGAQPVSFGFRIEFDFTMDAGREIWKAS
jgi:hypothetical protein